MERESSAPVEARVDGRPWDDGKSAKVRREEERCAHVQLDTQLVATLLEDTCRGCGMALGAA